MQTIMNCFPVPFSEILDPPVLIKMAKTDISSMTFHHDGFFTIR